ncbi:MAG TPA: hypothetical protein PK950_02220 [Candidatus Paceibacterota bacterium]|nr:hypothetical protein [Candidatus Paceibacterota bacterium]
MAIEQQDKNVLIAELVLGIAFTVAALWFLTRGTFAGDIGGTWLLICSVFIFIGCHSFKKSAS